MAGNWKEVRGTRVIDTSNVEFVDFVCTFQAAARTAQPLLGTVFANVQDGTGSPDAITASGCTAAAFDPALVANPEAVQVGNRQRFTENLDRIQVRFRGFRGE